ncbi:MAG: hypothetical protein Q7R31_02685 [Candidatus Levybacteria bacterium]|nr:hypothetical protein [Candidatus Levybacteria bacterium]
MKSVFIFLYVFFLLCFLIFSYLFIDPNFLYIHNIYSEFSLSKRQLTTVLYILFIFVLFAFYFLLLRLGKNSSFDFKDFRLYLILTIALLLFSYPAMLSYDIFNYTATSKVLFFYHENPYIIMPIEFTKDPLLLFMHAANKTALYGPVWILLTGIPYLLGFGNFLLTLFNFKLFIVIFYIGTISIIWKISKNFTTLLLFALNPLVIIETLLGGHNDIVMIFFALLAFYLLIKKKIFLAIIFIILSILIKYATLFLLPIFIYVSIKRIRKTEIKWDSVFSYSAILMIIAFLLSPIREEIYPWYAIWFLPFAFLVPKNKILLYLSISFSFGLLLRYIPFMFLGTYFGPTPLIKILVTFIPSVAVLLYFSIRAKLWQKNFSQYF